MADISLLEHIVEERVLQNSINYDDTILNCNFLDLTNATGEAQVILDGNEENPNVTNRDTQKINFNIYSTKDKPAKKDSEFFGRLSINLSLESHSKSRRFES